VQPKDERLALWQKRFTGSVLMVDRRSHPQHGLLSRGSPIVGILGLGKTIVTHPQLDGLTLDSTLADLPLLDFQVSSHTLGQVIIAEFQQRPDLPGAIVADNHQIVGVISRTRFFELLSRLYSLERHLRQPSRIPLESLMRFEGMLKQRESDVRAIDTHYVHLKASCPIYQAAEIVLQGSEKLTYDPVVVEFSPGEYRLLDMRVLLLAQSRLLIVTNRELQDRDRQLRHQNTVLSDLAKDRKRNRGDLQAALTAVTEAATQTLDVEQASIWLYDATGERLRCVDRYQRQTGKHSAGFQRDKAEREDSFTSGAIASSTSKEFQTTLDVPILQDGKPIGQICLRSDNQPRRWTLDDENFVSSLAELVASAIESCHRLTMETALRQSEAKFAGAFRASPNPICINRLADGRFIEVNDSFLEISGYDRLEIIGHTSREVPLWASSQEQRRFRKLLQVQNQDLRNQDFNFRTQSGELRTMLVSTETIQLGNQDCILVIANDITERKQAEQALKQQREYLRLILENIPQQVFWKDPNLVFLGCNRNWAESAQLESPESVIGKTDYDLLPPELAQEFRAKDRKILETNQPELHQIAVKYRPGANGEKIWLDINKIPMQDSQGNLIGLLGVLEDITERKLAEEALQAEQEKSEKLLLNILPKAIAEKLKQGTIAIAEQFDLASILFADIVGFTSLAARMSPIELVNLLNQIFSTFDQLADTHGLEKIKTIGDAYMVAGGLPVPREDCIVAIADMALDMQQAIADVQTQTGESFQIRIGIHIGPVVAGTIGMKKFTYDLWGDTVNIASRMESQGLPGKIQVTAETYEHLKHQYILEKRGKIKIKGKGEMMAYWLIDKQ
jgi:PAS domain S-box-containing protein